MNVCMKATKRLSGMTKTGMTHFVQGARPEMVPRICSSPKRFPNRRMPSESGRTKLLINSIGNIRMASQGIGPAKCLRWPSSPFSLMPMAL
jgi:hypothetical protein